MNRREKTLTTQLNDYDKKVLDYYKKIYTNYIESSMNESHNFTLKRDNRT